LKVLIAGLLQLMQLVGSKLYTNYLYTGLALCACASTLAGYTQG